ncbi:MAG: hypothetical protein H6553_05525 [Chitinophagales bacterium]|nr:hypothetical protein [Chitinophagales bacterium]
MFGFIKRWIHKIVIKKAQSRPMVDIIEVRTKKIGLTQVETETDIRITNSFFLPIKILSIETDVYNSSDLVIGRMNYHYPKKIKGNSTEIFKTTTHLSNISAFFQALNHLLSFSVQMRSVGTCLIQFLWWTFEVPVDDRFEVKPHQVKMVEPMTEEEKQAKALRRAEKQKELEAQLELKKLKQAEQRAKRKAALEKRKEKYKERKYKKYQKEDKAIINEPTDTLPDDTLEILLNKEAIENLAKDVDKEEF